MSRLTAFVSRERSRLVAATWIVCLCAAGIPLASAVASLGRRARAGGLPAQDAPAASKIRPTAPPTEFGPYVQKTDHFGEITVAQPKIWQYERVNSLLDGLLRDVQGVSLADLTSLDPNATNGAAVRFVQSMLEIGAKYDQGAAALNGLALQNYQGNQALANAQTAANQSYLQQLYQERQATTGQLLTEMQLNSTLLAQLAAAPAGTDTSSLTAQQNAANAQVSGLQQQITSINSQIAAASTSVQPPLPNLASTSAGTPPETANTFSSFLGNLPSGLQQNLINQLQTPSLPATKRLDNFTTLLYERLAREISALQDDLMRDPQNLAFLVQFDVSLYPSKHAEDRVGVVEFTLNCDGCKVYSIYPGQSSYNLANYEGASKRYSFWGNVMTLFGLGISADYRRQVDTLHGDLVQSVYMSGFQEGGFSEDRGPERNGELEMAGQRFGWYYGSSPFEKLVTSGMRSTFAIITVPRDRVERCQKNSLECGAGLVSNQKNSDVEVEVDAHYGWAPRDNPRAHGSLHLPATPLYVALPGSEDASLPAVVLNERDRLHLLGIEYNPVYEPVPAGPNTPAATSPGTAQASASGTGPGSATVTVSGAGTATASSTGTGTTVANATASSPNLSASTSSGGASSPDAFTGCVKTNPCAGVLLKLAEPIDPNMVVTVRGQPLRRVRDWRGRATSILPAAQSASDMPSVASTTTAASTTAQPQRSENAATSSLLEADQLGPNTWMEVDSHRLLVNISEDLAGEEDFPAIQIVEPAKHALFVPVDLDTNFTEVVTNGFHLLGRDNSELISYACNHLTASGCRARPMGSSVHPAGPYPPETFLPLFLPEPDPQPINAIVGETGIQLLVGFDNDSGTLQTAPKPKVHKWLASRTQVILEDRELDLAWSLACYPQGEQLACDFPQQELHDAYSIVHEICNNSAYSADCPSHPNSDFPSIASLQLWVEQSDPDDQHANSFHSTAPARLGRFPVTSRKGSGPDAGFSPWHFEFATPERLTLTGCNYPDQGFQLGSFVELLGQHIPATSKRQKLEENPEKGCLSLEVPTIALTRPELVLTYPVPDDSHVSSYPPEYLSPSQFRPNFQDPTVTLRQSPAPQNGGFPVIAWTVDLLAGNVECNDALDVPKIFAPGTALVPDAPGNPQWVIGGQPRYLRHPNAASPFASCPQIPAPDWDQLSKDGQIHLVLQIDKANLGAYLEHPQIHVIRGGDQLAVGTLPDLRPLLLPTQLTVVPIGDKQFALQGQNADAIDAVALQGPGAPAQPVPVAVSPGIAIVTLPAAGKSQSSATGGQSTIKSLSSPSSQAGSILTISGENFGSVTGTVLITAVKPVPSGAPARQVAPVAPDTKDKKPAEPAPSDPNAKPAPVATSGATSAKPAPAGAKPVVVSKNAQVVCWGDTSVEVIVPDVGTGGYKVTVKRGTGAPAGPNDFEVVGAAVSAAKADCPAGAAPATNSSGATYTVVPLIVTAKDASNVPTGYFPISNSDAQGKPAPLTWVVPAAQKTDTAAAKTPSPTETITITKQTSGAQTPTPGAAPAANGAAPK